MASKVDTRALSRWFELGADRAFIEGNHALESERRDLSIAFARGLLDTELDAISDRMGFGAPDPEDDFR